MSAASIANDIDDLYRRAIEQPSTLTEPVLMEWAEVAAESTGHDREQARALRKAVRTSRKLAKYWMERESGRLPDWRHGVDEALGGPGWQAQLDLVRTTLMAAPDPDLFDQVKERHRAAHFTEWMEGLTFEEWQATLTEG